MGQNVYICLYLYNNNVNCQLFKDQFGSHHPTLMGGFGHHPSSQFDPQAIRLSRCSINDDEDDDYDDFIMIASICVMEQNILFQGQLWRICQHPVGITWHKTGTTEQQSKSHSLNFSQMNMLWYMSTISGQISIDPHNQEIFICVCKQQSPTKVST